MDKNYLLSSAKYLKQVNTLSANEYIQLSDRLADKMNTLMFARPDLESLIGANNTDMMKDNHANHVRFIGSILKNYNPEVFVDTVLWVFRAYRSHDFTTNYWAAQLNAWFVILKENLSESAYSEISTYYEWMQINIPIFVIVSDDYLNAPQSIH